MPPVPSKSNESNRPNKVLTPQRQFLLAAVIVAVIVLAYIPAVRGGLFWDDGALVTGNPMVIARDGLLRLWFTADALEYVPLTTSTHWVEWRLWGGHPAGYHAVNVLLHAVAAILLWRVLKRLSIPGAWLAGLFFGIHPVTAASVAWISERKNTLSMALYLLSLLAYLTYDEREDRRWYVLALASFLLALLAKTSVVMLPVVLLLCAWWRRGAIRRKDILHSVPFFALSVVLGLVTIWFQLHNAIHGEIVRPEGAASRVAAAGWIVWFHLWKVVFPVGLCVIYPRWNVDGSSAFAFVPLALLAAVVAFLWARRRGWGRAPLFAMAYFVIMLLPVLGFVDMAFMRLSLAADHFQYLAMIGVIAFAAAILARAAASSGWTGRGSALVAAGCVVVLAGLTWRRASLYGDETRLWTDNLARNSAAWAAWSNLGDAYSRAGRYDEALRCCDKAIELNPNHADAYNNRTVVHMRLGRYDLGLADCERAIELKPNFAEAYNNRGSIHAQANRLAEAVQDYGKAVAFNPAFAEAYYNRAVACVRLGQDDLALRDYYKAIELKPDFAEAYNNRGNALVRANRLAEAIRDYDKAVALNPNLAQAYYNRSAAYYEMKEYGRALADVKIFQTMGGEPRPDFLKAVLEAAGRTE